MSLNKEYAALMGNGVKSLVENHKYEKTTHQITFDADKVKAPEGITQESLANHVAFINDTSAQVRSAVAEIGRNEFANNDKLTTVSGALTYGGVVFNSQHNLKQQAGEDVFYGQSVTAVDYSHSSDNTQWIAEQDKSNTDLATKLFG